MEMDSTVAASPVILVTVIHPTVAPVPEIIPGTLRIITVNTVMHLMVALQEAMQDHLQGTLTEATTAPAARYRLPALCRGRLLRHLLPRKT